MPSKLVLIIFLLHFQYIKTGQYKWFPQWTHQHLDLCLYMRVPLVVRYCSLALRYGYIWGFIRERSHTNVLSAVEPGHRKAIWTNTWDLSTISSSPNDFNSNWTTMYKWLQAPTDHVWINVIVPPRWELLTSTYVLHSQLNLNLC